MKKATLLFLSMIILFPVFAQTEKRITILHTNDLHSRLIGYAPESAYTPLTVNDDNTIGGFARIAAIIKAEKDKAAGTTLVLDAGDSFMGTLFPILEKETGFQLRLMKTIGYDAIANGNHEFDFGPEWLAEIISISRSKGEIPPILTGNALFDKKDDRDDSLEKLYNEGLISRRLILIKEGLKIGIFSLLGKEAQGVAPKAKPVTFARPSSFAKKMVAELKAEKCDVIICLSHSGLSKEKNGEWGGADVELAKAVKGINIIIGGHSHTKLEQPLVVNGTTIVQAGEFGQFVGRLSLIFSNGKLNTESYGLIPVDDMIAGDMNVNQLIEEQKERLTKSILQPLGMDYRKPVVETDFTVEGNDLGDYVGSNLGPLVADAIHYYVNHNKGKGTDVSMVAAGMLFDKILPGIQAAPDVFKVMPLGSGNDNVPGYALSRLYVTGKELKSIIEILLVSYKSSPDNYCYYSGIRVEYDPAKGLLKKISKIEIVHPDGTLSNVDFSKGNKTLYSVTANSYMLGFIGIIKKKSFGLINVEPKDFTGKKMNDMKEALIDMDESTPGIQEGKEWLALIKYLGSMTDTNGNGIPDIERKYAGPVRCFFPVSAK
jgi:5'-nucleotidase/UDP-sugar diphosphatase